jgi:hypothetical protein
LSGHLPPQYNKQYPQNKPQTKENKMSAKTYTFTIKDKEYSIPTFKNISIGILRKTHGIEDEMAKSFTILELTLEDSPETLAAIDTLSVDEFAEWIKGWLGDATLGESSGSES